MGSIDSDIERELARAETYDEAFKAVQRVLIAHGHPASDEMTGTILESHLGGDVVEIDEQGLPVHPLRRRFELAEQGEDDGEL